jgi:hypothetical protein
MRCTSEMAGRSPKLVGVIGEVCGRAKHPLRDSGTVGAGWQGHDVFPGFRGKAEESHDLRHPRTGDVLPAGDIGLVPDFAGVELAPPLDGLAEEFRYAGSLGASWLLEIAPAQRNDAHDLVGFYPSRQDADVAVFNDPHGPEGDFYRLFAAGCLRGAILARYGGVDDSKPNFRPCGA